MLPIYTKEVKNLSSNARNWPFVILIRKNIKFKAAIWAQEAYESSFKMNPINLVRFLFSKTKIEMEIFGHEVEVQTAAILYKDESFNFDYRKSEVIAMKNGYGGLFDDITENELYEKMKSQQNNARKWVNKNLKQIKKHM